MEPDPADGRVRLSFAGGAILRGGCHRTTSRSSATSTSDGGTATFAPATTFFDPLVLFVMRPEFPDAGACLGLERLAEYTRGFLEPWSRITIEAEELISAGGTVVAAVSQRGVGEEGGAATELRYFHVWSFRGDRVIRLECFRERPEALAAAGMSEHATSQKRD